MKSIYIGVCKTREDEKFRKSFSDFTNAISEEYSVCIQVIKDTFLPDAQNMLARACVDGRYDYLLLLDDDHWGHTKEMLETLINANAYMATIKSYSRHYPYSCCLMKRIMGGYAGVENGEGYQEVDFTGFPMTLIKCEVFEKLPYPWFRAKVEGQRNWTTDEPFCKSLQEIGIKPMGCFQHTLPHQDITEENVRFRREKEIPENRGLYILYNMRQRVLMQGALT